LARRLLLGFDSYIAGSSWYLAPNSRGGERILFIFTKEIKDGAH